MKLDCQHLKKPLFGLFAIFLVGLMFAPENSWAATPEKKDFYSTAVLDFSVRNRKQEELGGEIAMLLTAYLSDNQQLLMVERQDIETLISEQALGKSGTVQQDTVAKVGQLTGAKIIISGTVMSLGDEQTLIAKIMGTETGRVFGVPVKVGKSDSMTDACLVLAEKINEKISQNATSLVASETSSNDFIAKKKTELQGKKLPSVAVEVSERHIGQDAIDPAAETEVLYILQELGFTIIDQTKSNEKPDILITGEAFSETGITRGEFVSSKGRVELKAIERQSGKILCTDRKVEVAVDMSAQIAGKAALQKAAASLTEKLIDNILTL